jgi:methyl-accepting chemotaxis protein
MVTVVLTMVMGVIAVLALRFVVASKDAVISVHAQSLIDAERLHVATERVVAAARGFLLIKEERILENVRSAHADVVAILERLRSRITDPESKRLLERVVQAQADWREAADQLISLRKSDASIESVLRRFEEQMVPRYNLLDRELNAFITRESLALEEGKRSATEASSSAITFVIAIASTSALFAGLAAFFLTRSLSGQVGSAIQHVQNSSAELQAASNQQATGAKEQATAMNEISTTISELLATSRQIAESAQRVSLIAEQTAGAAGAGDRTVQKGQESIGLIRKQVDLIVDHMLDLGKKAQQIGGVLEIINELAEQTNILAINATIEAAGAGEAGKRFAVVADEIRKLADRVAASTKEIRGLIEETRSAVNTTVMATETGSKAVDMGSRQFAEVTAAIKQIADLVRTTSEAAREIELSTKQQSTAVEQVNVAISDVAQTTKETETSSNQTFQTATQLTQLSHALTRFIQSEARP